MNQEEKKAIEILNTFELRRKTKNYKEISLEDSQSVETLLNLIEKLQKENEEWQRAYQEEKDRQFDLIKDNEKLKEYIAKAPNLDEMTATKYRNIQQEAYIQGRAVPKKEHL